MGKSTRQTSCCGAASEQGRLVPRSRWCDSGATELKVHTVRRRASPWLALRRYIGQGNPGDSFQPRATICRCNQFRKMAAR